MAKTLNKWLDEFVENGADANNVTDWPENAGGGGDSTGLILGTELVVLQGKHIDVDKLIALIQKYDVDNTNQDLQVGLSAQGDSAPTIGIVELADNSGLELHILGNIFTGSLDYESGDNLATLFTNNKVAIENFTMDSIPSDIKLSLFLPYINGTSEYEEIVPISKQEILDLFVD